MTVKHALAQSDIAQRMYIIYLDMQDVQRMFDHGAIGWKERNDKLSVLRSQFEQKRQEYDAEICAEVMET